MFFFFFFFQAEDGIRDFCLSRGLGDVYKRQPLHALDEPQQCQQLIHRAHQLGLVMSAEVAQYICLHSQRNMGCLLYTSDAADEEDSVDLGGRRSIKKKKKKQRKPEKQNTSRTDKSTETCNTIQHNMTTLYMN